MRVGAVATTEAAGNVSDASRARRKDHRGNVQEQWYGPVVDGHFTCWPECRKHSVGLHPEVRDGHAVWWCRPGQHAVAAIGRMDSVS